MNKEKSGFFTGGLTLRCLWVFLALIAVPGSAGCGESSSRGNPWQEDVFYPSDNFYQYCADPGKAFSTGARQGTYVDENNWLRSWSHETYLWYDEIEDINPACCSTPEYFGLMKTKETTSSGKPKDRFHFSRPTKEWRLLMNEGITAGYGARFRVLQDSPPRNVVVAYTEPGSPATATDVSLVRGTRILGVDGIDIVNSTDENEIGRINAALYPSDGDTHTFTVRDPGSSSRERSVTMTAKEITLHPVQKVKVITTPEGDRTGYMLFNRQSAPAAQPLIDAGKMFLEGEGIDDLVLDLRYNGGGFLYIARIITSIIAGSAGAGKNFSTTEYNDKRDSESTPFAATFRDDQLPYLDLPRLFVLTGPGTCSASELIINSLRGIDTEVILVGSTTCGKYYGFFSTDNCGTTYSTIQLRIVNNKGVADYDDGFPPTCFVADNDYDHQLGDPEESLLKTALAYRADDACPSSGSAQLRKAATKSSRGESLSIDPVSSPYSGIPGLILDQ